MVDKMLNLTIDDRQVQVEQGTSILATAKKIGIDIPTLCFLKEINDVGSCRVCVVEVEGEDQLVAACNNPAKEGMVVNTNGPRVRRVRKMNVELLLSQHDVQCTNCVRSGNCQLQTMANDLNLLGPRLKRELEENDWPEDFPLIRDTGKCIKCLRCINVCNKIQAVGVWDQKNRATRSTIGVADAVPIKESLCTLCGQCITYCPVGALRERDDTMRVIEALEDPDIVTAVQIAPSVRVAWGEALGLLREEATVKRLVTVLRGMGFDYVFDTDFAADLTVMEEGSELLERVKNPEKHDWPMFTSCCPGWVRYMKGHHPDMVDQLSTAKSPQQMFGAVMKTYFPQSKDIDAKKFFTVSIMPCVSKKNESTLPGMDSAGAGQDVDVVLTIRELQRMIKAEHVNAGILEEAEFDQPFGLASGAGVIFGTSGGVMEAALRSAYYLATGENPDADAFTEVRGLENWKEEKIDIAGTILRVAVVSGLANAERLIQALKAGEKSYDFVEVMACPGGCIGGGGQPITQETLYKSERSKGLYGLDKRSDIRFAHENPAVISAYENFFMAPLSERSHHYLHADHGDWKMPNES